MKILLIKRVKYAISCITASVRAYKQYSFGVGARLCQANTLNYAIRLYSRELAATKVLLNVSRSDAGNQRVEKTARPSFR